MRQTPKSPIVTLWATTGFFLLLSAWLVPGAIWGTSDNSPLSGGYAYAVALPVLIIALILLGFTIRVHRRRQDR